MILTHSPFYLVLIIYSGFYGRGGGWKGREGGGAYVVLEFIIALNQTVVKQCSEKNHSY